MEASQWTIKQDLKVASRGRDRQSVASQCTIKQDFYTQQESQVGVVSRWSDTQQVNQCLDPQTIQLVVAI